MENQNKEVRIKIRRHLIGKIQVVLCLALIAMGILTLISLWITIDDQLDVRGFNPVKYVNLASGIFTILQGLSLGACGLANIDNGPKHLNANHRSFTHVVYAANLIGIIFFYTVSIFDFLISEQSKFDLYLRGSLIGGCFLLQLVLLILLHKAQPQQIFVVNLLISLHYVFCVAGVFVGVIWIKNDNVTTDKMLTFVSATIVIFAFENTLLVRLGYADFDKKDFRKYAE